VISESNYRLLHALANHRKQEKEKEIKDNRSKSIEMERQMHADERKLFDREAKLELVKRVKVWLSPYICSSFLTVGHQAKFK